MIMLPTPLKAFTDVVPQVKAMLRACSFYTYGWRVDDPRLPTYSWPAVTRSPSYRDSWPAADRATTPRGAVPFNPRIGPQIERRLSELRRDLALSNTAYPAAAVRAILSSHL